MGVMNLSEILDSSAFLLRKNIKSFMWFNLLYLLITTGVSIVLFIPIVLFVALSSVFFTKVDPTGIGLVSGIVVLCFLGFLFFKSIWGAQGAGVVEIARRDSFGIKTPMGEILVVAMKSVFGIFAMEFILAIPMCIIGAVFVFLSIWYAGLFGIVMNEFALSTADLGAAIGVLLVLGFAVIGLLFVVVLTMYYTLFTLRLQIMLVEKCGPIRAITKSVHLVSGNYWRFFSVYNLIMLLTYGIGVSITLFFVFVLGLLELGVHFLGGPAGFFTTILSQPVSNAASLFRYFIFSPLWGIFFTQMYFNRRCETEAFDLQLRLNALQKEMFSV